MTITINDYNRNSVSSLSSRAMKLGMEWDYSLSRLAASGQVFGANSSGHPSTVCRGKSTAGTCPSKGRERGREEEREISLDSRFHKC